MSNIIIKTPLRGEELIRQMREDSKFEIAGDGDADATSDICCRQDDSEIINQALQIHGKKNPPKVPKLYVAGHCIFNCAYCGCRNSYEKPDYCGEPRELARCAVEEAKKNTHGIFISSAIHKNADYTQELIAETLRIMRQELFYQGYLHAKIMPGADPLLIAKTGLYASRLSVNIEVANSAGYNKIAKQKTRENILTPMGNISAQMYEAKMEKRKFAYSQTTQLMAGSTDENDRTIMNLSSALYKKYRLKRVYYTPFAYKHEAKGYENENLIKKITPYWRMARLYQADRLLQLYGFTPDDVTPEEDPFLHEDIDPKAAWAMRHLDMYPVEVNKADYETLLRVPGIGITYANRIISVRKHTIITHDILQKMRVSLKRAVYFITCNGTYKGGSILGSAELFNAMSGKPDNMSISASLTDGIDTLNKGDAIIC